MHNRRGVHGASVRKTNNQKRDCWVSGNYRRTFEKDEENENGMAHIQNDNRTEHLHSQRKGERKETEG